MKDAINQAKADLGDEVTVLESRQINGNGSSSNGEKIFQITVALEDNHGEMDQIHNRVPSNLGTKDQMYFSDYFSEIVSQKKSDNYLDLEVNSEFTSLLSEMKILTRRLRKMTSPELPELYAKIFEKLLIIGISEDHASSLVRRAFLRLEDEPNQTREKILEAVKSEVLSLFLEEEKVNEKKNNDNQQIITFIGPTGVGKTISIMKLAIHPEIFGQKNVGIISTDMYRVAPSEPLNSFSKLTSIPVAEIRNPAEIPAQIKKFKDKEIILVDTAGRSPYFPNYIQQLQKYLSVIKPDEIFLVLSLTTDLEDLYFISGLYLSLNPTGVIYTKLDETCRVGKIVSMKKEIGLPANYISDGQSIPDNIKKVEGELIWERIIKSG